MSTQISSDLVDRMAALIRDLHADHVEQGVFDRVQDFVARTAAIVSELPKQVDPDLIEAREICARHWEMSRKENGLQEWHRSKAVREGKHDEGHDVVCSLAAIKRGRELARSTFNDSDNQREADRG